MDGRIPTLGLLLCTISGCINVPGKTPEGRHRSHLVDAALWRRPSNYAADRSGDPVLEFAKCVTEIEDDLRRDGSITVKQPDVWGEGNLLDNIQEYDGLMKDRTKKFAETIQASVKQNDRASFEGELNLSYSLKEGGGGGGESSPAVVASLIANANQVPNQIITLNSNPNLTSSPTLSSESSSNASAAASASAGGSSPDGSSPGGGGGIALEPTEVARQESVYIDVCQALRRRHMGDDNSRGPGYSLYKVRVPVSVLPGRETSKGFSAVATLRAKLQLDEAHLRYTFPRLAMADSVQYAISRLNPSDINVPVFSSRGAAPEIQFLKQTSVQKQNQSTSMSSPELSAYQLKEDAANVSSILAHVVKESQSKDGSFPRDEELRSTLTRLFGKTHIAMQQAGIYQNYGDVIHEFGREILRGNYKAVDDKYSDWCVGIKEYFKSDAAEGMVEASWILALQTGVLNQNLKRIAVRLGHEREIMGADESLYDDSRIQFYNLDNGSQAETVELWSQIISKEFPLYVFSLDPQVEEQNVNEAMVRARQMQLALAYKVAKSPLSADSAIKASRDLALEMETIGLNRTVVSFAHGTDTFGWYFHPRVQAPPPESTNIGALARTIWSTGPTEHYDLKHREIEPGIRECEVLIAMPSFVQKVSFDVTTNWECLAKPGVTKRSYEEMLAQGRKIHQVKNCVPDLRTQACYRPGDVERLLSRVDQLDSMLGMQTHTVKLPFKYDQSGNGLFGQGRSDLHPVITGFYGLQFLEAGEKTKAHFFLRGTNFHPTLTRVITGGFASDSFGKPEVRLHSRELISVEVEIQTKALSDKNVFEVRVGTPDGMSNPQFIPIAKEKEEAKPTGFSIASPTLLSAKYEVPCSGAPKFSFVPPFSKLLLSFEPTSDFKKVIPHWIQIKITAVSSDGKPIVFRNPDSLELSTDLNEIIYNADKKWELKDGSVDNFWTGIEQTISQHPPMSDGQKFQMSISILVATDVTNFSETLNKIIVNVDPCNCK